MWGVIISFVLPTALPYNQEVTTEVPTVTTTTEQGTGGIIIMQYVNIESNLRYHSETDILNKLSQLFLSVLAIINYS